MLIEACHRYCVDNIQGGQQIVGLGENVVGKKSEKMEERSNKFKKEKTVEKSKNEVGKK